MFNVGGGEFLVIGLIALIVLGPQRLPDAARQVGKAMGELRRLSTGFQNEVRDAFADTEAPTPQLAPRRNVLATPTLEGPAERPAVASAVDAVSGERPKRRKPLQAEPLPKGARARGNGG